MLTPDATIERAVNEAIQNGPEAIANLVRALTVARLSGNWQFVEYLVQDSTNPRPSR